MDKVILVTGANGFVGKHVLRGLSGIVGLKLVAVDVQESLAESLRGIASIEYVKGDLAGRAFIDALTPAYRFDSIIHLAAIISQASDMNTYFAIMNSNIRATFLLLELAKAHSARFIFPSTALVYGPQAGPFKEEMLPDPGDFYALSKQMSEQLIRFYGNRYGVPSVIFRIGILYGPAQANAMFIPSLVSSLLSGKEFPMTGGEQKRDFVYVEDLLNAIRIVLDKKDAAGIFNIGTGAAVFMKDVAVLIEELVGVKNKVRLGAIPYRTHEAWDYCLDNSKARSALGWEPKTSLRDGLRETIEYRRKAMVGAEAAAMRM